MSEVAASIPSSLETGAIGIMHLKRYWAITTAKRKGLLHGADLTGEWDTDNFLLNTLGLGIEQTIKQLYIEQLDFAQFESWIIAVNNGIIDAGKIAHFNSFFTGQTALETGDNNSTNPVLSPSDLAHWDEQGYVIVRQVISKEDSLKTIAVICDFLQIDIHDPATWYKAHPAKEGIMVQFFQHPVLETNRHAPKIRRAYEQLWGRKDILVNTDKVGFNPPEIDRWKFQGSRLHWDVSLELPIPFGVQGLLYLSDTVAEQGAFTVVPGFHKKINKWIINLAPGTDPRKENLYELGAIAVPANAGDFIIWNHALPHAGSPNRTDKPRFVQYINYAPVHVDRQDKWK